MKIAIWMNIPSHHQSQFFDTLHSLCNDFKVIYYCEIPSSRSNMGWDTPSLKDYESRFDYSNQTIDIDECKNYIHIIPGYSHALLRKLRKTFSKESIPWIHWSEKSTSGWKWYATYYRKRIHAYYINKYALGALAIGEQARKDFIKWGVKPSKIQIIPYSINSLVKTPTDQIILNFKKNRKAILYVGSLYDGKGVDLLIEAFANNFKNNPNWCLVLVGNHKEGYNYKREADRLEVSEQILFRGIVKSSEIYSVYSACDVFVLPSRYDGWGMVTNEALFSELPIIISSAAGASDHLVEHGINGFVFKSGSLEQLTRYLDSYKDENLISSHKNKSKVIFKEYSSERLSKKLLKTINGWLSL